MATHSSVLAWVSLFSFAFTKRLSVSQSVSHFSLSCVQLFMTPRITACQVSLSITNSWSSLRHEQTCAVGKDPRHSPLTHPWQEGNWTGGTAVG